MREGSRQVERQEAESDAGGRMTHWHNGPIRKCGPEFKWLVTFFPPLFIVEWKDRGYYAGWIDDELWESFEKAGRVTKLSWWRLW